MVELEVDYFTAESSSTHTSVSFALSFSATVESICKLIWDRSLDAINIMVK